MKVRSKVIEINNLLTVQLEKINLRLDYIEKNILVHPNNPAPPPLDIKWWPPYLYLINLWHTENVYRPLSDLSANEATLSTGFRLVENMLFMVPRFI